jgi:hypothetical protein
MRLRMEILEDKEAKIFFEETRKRNAQLQEEQLNKAKQESLLTDKESFDLVKLKTYLDTKDYTKTDLIEQEQKELEYKYYVTSSVMTIADFAKELEQIIWWNHG